MGHVLVENQILFSVGLVYNPNDSKEESYFKNETTKKTDSCAKKIFALVAGIVAVGASIVFSMPLLEVAGGITAVVAACLLCKGSRKNSERLANSYYEGELQNGEPHVEEYHENGNLKYKGQFQNGERHGKGEFYHKNGKLAYKGEWKDGNFHGKGKRYHKNGNIRYEGEYQNGERHGKGTCYHENGKLAYDGQWKDGEKVDK